MSAPLHRRCPECNREVYLVTGRRSGKCWFEHPDCDCINADWKQRLHFNNREEAMKAPQIFKA